MAIQIVTTPEALTGPDQHTLVGTGDVDPGDAPTESLHPLPFPAVVNDTLATCTHFSKAE